MNLLIWLVEALSSEPSAERGERRIPHWSYETGAMVDNRTDGSSPNGIGSIAVRAG